MKAPALDHLAVLGASVPPPESVVSAHGGVNAQGGGSPGGKRLEEEGVAVELEDRLGFTVGTEGLYAEALRHEGLVESLQRELRIVIAGPTTLTALLNSLQMGFRTLAVQKRSSEVWKVLGAVKTEFTKFGGILDKVQKKLDEATTTIGEASSKTRNIERKLGKVQELPEGERSPALELPDGR